MSYDLTAKIRRRGCNYCPSVKNKPEELFCEDCPHGFAIVNDIDEQIRLEHPRTFAGEHLSCDRPYAEVLWYKTEHADIRMEDQGLWYQSMEDAEYCDTFHKYHKPMAEMLPLFVKLIPGRMNRKVIEELHDGKRQIDVARSHEIKKQTIHVYVERAFRTLSPMVRNMERRAAIMFDAQHLPDDWKTWTARQTYVSNEVDRCLSGDIEEWLYRSARKMPQDVLRAFIAAISGSFSQGDVRRAFGCQGWKAVQLLDSVVEVLETNMQYPNPTINQVASLQWLKELRTVQNKQHAFFAFGLGLPRFRELLSWLASVYVQVSWSVREQLDAREEANGR